MGLNFTPWALPGLAAGMAAWAAAIVLLRTAPHRSLNRRLAAVLFLEGLWLGGSVFFMIDDPALFRIVAAVAVAAMAALPFQYLAFLGVALRIRLVAPFRNRWAFFLLTLASGAAAGAVLFSPDTFLGELYSPDWATWNFTFRPAGTLVARIHAGASLFGLVAAVTAFLGAARGTSGRARAKWFAIAFGLRDLFTAASYGLYPVLRPVEFWGDFVYNAAGALVTLVYVLLLSYGVLHVQLFDIDLKLKLALKGSTVGGVFAAAFFTGSELLEHVVPVEGTILGIVVAGAIVVVLRPVQRLAEALAGRVFPVEDSPTYVRDRKHAVYRAAVEGAVEDGRISERERAILARLREQLEIRPGTADALEREVAAAAASGD